MFTSKEIQETNAKTEERMRRDALFEIKKVAKPDQTFTAEQVANIFVVLAAKIIYVPTHNKLGLSKD